MKLVIAAAAVLNVAGCAGTTAGLAPDLVRAWRVEDIDEKGVIDDALATVAFAAEGRVSGRGGCNNYSGEYIFRDGLLSVGPLASTKMACAPALMDMEQKLLTRLAGELAATTSNDGALILTDREGRLLLRPLD